MSKRILALLLIPVLLLLTAPAMNSAAANDTVTVRTAQELVELSANCVLDTWSEGKTIILENDIDLSGCDFSPIAIFSGRLDGKGHTIKGLKLTDAMMTAGFIRLVTAGGTVENLHIIGEVTPDGACTTVGGVAGENNGTLRNCTFSGAVKGYERIGGICGLCGTGGVIENCRADGSVSGEHRAGGIVGENAGVVRSCINRAEVNTQLTEASAVDVTELSLGGLDLGGPDLNLTKSSEELIDITDIGGVAGYSSGVIRGCENRGTIGHRHIGYNIGGIAGHLSGYADACVNAGKVYGRKDVGGIIGQTDPYTGWDFSGEKLTELKQKLTNLRDNIAGLADDVSYYSAQLSGQLAGVMDSLSRADAALDTLSGDALTFINDNVDVVNQLSERITEGLGAVVPALSELGVFLNGLPAAFDGLSTALDSMADAAEITDSVYHSVSTNITAAKTALANARAAVGGIKQSIDNFIKKPDINSAGELISAIAQKLGTARTELTNAKDALIAARDALTGLPDAGDKAAEAIRQLSEAADSIDGTALTSLAHAEELFTAAVDTFSRYDALRFSPVNTDESTRKGLFSSLADSFTGFSSVAAQLDASWLSEDTKAVSEAFFSLVDFVTDAIGGHVTANDANLLKDISSDGADKTVGTVKGCKNTAAVDAQTNGGGIVGAISLDISFDLEDEFNLSSLLTGSTKYLIYACVAACVNTSAVTVKKDAAGGIVGRMDYGAVKGCESSGSVAAEGSYAGGVAGLSRGSIQNCAARVNLSAGSYVGGIAGCGSDIGGCCAVPSIDRRVVYCGAVAGDADGELKGNYYSMSEIGGVNGFSFAGQAEPAAYNDLVKKSGAEDLFGTVTVTFVKDGESIKEVAVPFGGSVDSIPTLPDRDGKRWMWDSFDNTAIYRSITVQGSYVSPVTVLSTGEDVPQFLAEGSFVEGQQLSVVPYHDATADAAPIAACTVTVNGYDGILRVHMRTDTDGELTAIMRAGERRAIPYTRDGSYIVFELNSGDSLVYTAAEKSPWLYIVLGAGSAILIAAAVILRVKKKPRKN